MGTVSFVRVTELGEGIYKFLVNENPQTLPVFEAKMPLKLKRRYYALRWKHRTHGGVNHVVIGKDVAGLFPKVLECKEHMVLSESQVTGAPIVSGRMQSLDSNVHFKNKSIM